jgi:hypothetical protein
MLKLNNKQNLKKKINKNLNKPKNKSIKNFLIKSRQINHLKRINLKLFKAKFQAVDFQEFFNSVN